MIKSRNLILFLCFFQFISCKQFERNNQTQEVRIYAVLMHIKETGPSSRVYGDIYEYDGDYNNNYDVDIIKDDKYSYCHSFNEVLKIEILGNIPNAKIQFADCVDEPDGKIVYADRVNVVGEFTIYNPYHPWEGSYNLEIFSNDSLVKSIKVYTEPCY